MSKIEIAELNLGEVLLKNAIGAKTAIKKSKGFISFVTYGEILNRHVKDYTHLKMFNVDSGGCVWNGWMLRAALDENDEVNILVEDASDHHWHWHVMSELGEYQENEVYVSIIRKYNMDYE